MESFNNWLVLREQSENNTVLAVFDFDGTVANVPEKPSPDDDKHHWDGKDWWGSSASLESPFYDGWVNDEVVSAFKKANSNPETHAILLTGRRSVVAPWVKKVLDNIGLGGVEQHFNGDHRNKSDYIKNKNRYDNFAQSFYRKAQKSFILIAKKNKNLSKSIKTNILKETLKSNVINIKKVIKMAAIQSWIAAEYAKNAENKRQMNF